MLLVTAFGFSLSLSPGPSMFYVFSRSLSSGVWGGLLSSGGLAFGGMLHVLLAAFIGSTILNLNSNVFLLMQVGGVAYLFYLGIIELKKVPFSSNPNSTTVELPRSKLKLFLNGVFVEATNPKTTLFFLTILPQFVRKEIGSVPLQMIILGSLIPLTAIPSDLAVVFFTDRFVRRLNNPKTVRLIHRISGLVLITLSLYLSSRLIPLKF